LTINGFLCSQISGVCYAESTAIIQEAAVACLAVWNSLSTIKIEAGGSACRLNSLLMQSIFSLKRRSL
jgi:hypothetical protein